VRNYEVTFFSNLSGYYTDLTLGTEKSIIFIVGYSYLVLEFPHLTLGFTKSLYMSV